MKTTEVMTHLWQDQGLGIAPFHIHCLISFPDKSLCEYQPEAYNRACYEASSQGRALGVDLCICQSCGMCLQHNAVIRDANKKFFVVGMDCAMKTGDVKIMAKVKYLERERQKKIREVKAEEARIVRNAAMEARLAEQRAKNDGKTEHEVAVEKREKFREETRAANSKKFAWILEVLDNEQKSDFIQSVIAKIELYGLAEISDKMRNILTTIYAKRLGGRYGSKKYNAAADEFDKKFEDGMK